MKVINRIALAVACLVLPLCAYAKTVHTIGDSTMAEYSADRVTKGWGQMFQQFFTDDITVNNRAKSGASSKSFYEESAYWASVKKQIKEGDYVIIQFAHNDEKNGGMDGDEVIAYYNSIGDSNAAAAVDYRGTTASGTYKEYLRKYVNETRALGATPILASAICREYFENGKIKRSGRHDLGDKFDVLTKTGISSGNKVPAEDHTYDYSYQMQLVAEELDVDFIDLTVATRDLYESYGASKCDELLFDGDGSTHTSAMGATLIARLAAQLLKEQDILTQYISLTSELTSSPAEVNFGEAYKGQELKRDFYISGFDLTPAAGTLKVTAPKGVTLSVDGTNYSSEVEISYEGGNVIGTVYAKCKFEEEGDLNGVISVTDGTNSLNIPVSGKCIVLGGDVESSAVWRLESDNSCKVDGAISPIGQSFSGMVVQRYQSPNANTVWPEWTGFTADRKVQRCVIEGESWPAGEIDEVSSRWIEFAVKPASGAVLNVDKISMFVCGCGGNGMRCKIYYSKEENFANPVEIAYFSEMPSNNMLYVEDVPVLKLNDDETLRVRIYPWYSSAATGKTICVSDVTIHGMAEYAEQAVNANGTVSWAFNKGANNEVVGETNLPDAISSSSWSLGENIYFDGTQATNSNVMMSKMRPYEAVAKARDAKTYVKYTIIPKKGVEFVPTKLNFSAAKFGTSGGTFDVVAVRNGVETNIATGVDPARNNVDPFHTDFEYSLSSVNPGDKLDIYIYIYNLAANKHLGLSNVVITGQFVGNPQEVPVYTISAAPQDAAAGTVTISPTGDNFDEGTEVTLTASENFGYHFAAWVDAAGNEVSTENPYTFPLMANTELYATYTKNNVYALNVAVEGGANDYMVQFEPAGNVINGVHHYEEGTQVRLTATNNRIISFVSWEDNSTSAVRDLTVTADTELKATYSADDYIVGWDLYYDEPKSQRAADFCADSENAGLLSLRNAAGATSTWLAGGVEKGQQRGHYCARVWRPIKDGFYFEISFSSVGYSNLRLSALLGNDFVSYVKYDVEYSVDGVSYTKFAEYSLPNRGWTEGENTLPAEANNQTRVYVRFMPDTTSGFTGANWETSTVESTDGFSVAEIFVLADPDSASDALAPVLLSTIPANQSTGASATGQVVLTFDEKIVLANDAATLNGEAIAGSVTGKTASFKYSGLDYNTSYTFALPAGAITDCNGNAFEGVTFTFTTMERVQPEARLFDAIVAQDGSGDYTTVQAAIDAAPANRVKPWLVFIKEGYYKEHVEIPASKPFIHFIGQDREKVRICDDLLCGGDNAVHVDAGATVVARANDLYFEGISFENEYGRDKKDGPQALALNTKGDRIAFNNVKMISYQDTWITTSESNYRHYVTNSWIEGAVDFIYNSGNVFVENSVINIVRKSGGYIVAPRHAVETKWGYVFLNNTITAPGVPSETSVWLGRPWHDFPLTVFINTRAEVTIPATGWYETMGGLPRIWADYNTVDGDGNPVDLSMRRDTYYYVDDNGEKVYGTAKNYLTPEEAAEYTVDNVCSGDDNWDPALIAEPCAAPVAKAENDVISWEAVPYAICYVVTIDGKVAGFTTETSYDMLTDGKAHEYSVQAASEFGALSKACVVPGSSLVESIVADNVTPEYYNLQGVRVANPQSGIYIVVRGGKASKEVL
ncbi:MAG: Ig-like domain-containing protein [Muribaculaceae bacterium]|nr:Ig-like domain-containing protein [Muribaculaceae bacterium]